MNEQLVNVQTQIDRLARWAPSDLGVEASTALLQAQLEIRRLLRQPDPKDAPTGILRAITEALAEVEELRNAVPTYTVYNHLGVSEAFHIGKLAAYSQVMAALEGIYAAYEQDERPT